jgi:hypothetical protein
MLLVLELHLLTFQEAQLGLVGLYGSVESVVLAEEIGVFKADFVLKAGNYHLTVIQVLAELMLQRLTVIHQRIPLLTKPIEITQQHLLSLQQPTDLSLVLVSQRSHSILLLIQISSQRAIDPILMADNLIESTTLRLKGLGKLLELQILGRHLSSPLILQLIKLSLVELPNPIDLPGLLSQDILKLLPEGFPLLVQLFVQGDDLAGRAFLIYPGQLLGSREFFLGVFEVLGGQLEVLGELLVGVVAVVELVFELFDLPEQFGDPGFEFLLFGLSHLGVLFVFLQQLMDFEVVAGLLGLDELGMLLILVLEHLLVHLNLQGEALPNGVDLNFQLADLLGLHGGLAFELPNALLLDLNLFGDRDLLV